MQAIAELIVREAVRTRLLVLVLVVACAILGFTWFLSAVALTEGESLRAVVNGALLRTAFAVLLVVFVVMSMARELNDKAFDLLLSLPYPRWKLLAGKLAGYAIVALVLAGLATVAVALYAPVVHALLWGATFACEMVLLATFAAMCLMSLSQPTVALIATLAFYLLSRAIGAVQLMATGPLAIDTGLSSTSLVWTVDALATILPRLDLFARSEWLSGAPASAADVGGVLLQACVYIALLTAIALADLYRRNF